MDYRKRKKKADNHRRQMERHRRRQRAVLAQARRELRMLRAAFTLHGTDTGDGYGVEYLCVAVFMGGELIDNCFFDADEYADPQDAFDEGMDFALSHGVEQVEIDDGLYEPEYCCDCGERIVVIDDVLDPDRCEALGLKEGSRYADVKRMLAEAN